MQCCAVGKPQLKSCGMNPEPTKVMPEEKSDHNCKALIRSQFILRELWRVEVFVIFLNFACLAHFLAIIDQYVWFGNQSRIKALIDSAACDAGAPIWSQATNACHMSHACPMLLFSVPPHGSGSGSNDASPCWGAHEKEIHATNGRHDIVMTLCDQPRQLDHFGKLLCGGQNLSVWRWNQSFLGSEQLEDQAGAIGVIFFYHEHGPETKCLWWSSMILWSVKRGLGGLALGDAAPPTIRAAGRLRGICTAGMTRMCLHCKDDQDV